MTIEKHGNKWRVRQREKGKLYMVTLDHEPSEKEAYRAIYQKIGNLPPDIAKDMTFSEAVDAYCEMKSQVLSPSTIRGYKTVRNTLPELFTSRMLSTIDNLTIQRLINDYSVKHSPKTVKNAYGLIRVVTRAYVNIDISCTLPMHIKKEPYIPTDEEVKQLCNEAKSTPYWAYLMLGAYGLRRSEILAINPKTDLDGNTLKINKAMVQNEKEEWIVKATTKTASSTREIYICDALRDAIKDKDKVLKAHPSTVFQWMDRTQKALGMEHFSVHKLRHHFATVMSALLPEKDWLYLGGWATDHIAKTVYQHNQIAKNNEQKKIASDLLSQKLI